MIGGFVAVALTFLAYCLVKAQRFVRWRLRMLRGGGRTRMKEGSTKVKGSLSPKRKAGMRTAAVELEEIDWDKGGENGIDWDRDKGGDGDSGHGQDRFDMEK